MHSPEIPPNPQATAINAEAIKRKKVRRLLELIYTAIEPLPPATAQAFIEDVCIQAALLRIANFAKTSLPHGMPLPAAVKQAIARLRVDDGEAKT
ncbi:hypothetical protein [Chitinimonas lacunae]|uniref:Uncharacterized protein n=1 Tax=Chitinimonas lacunae TaxID=1963018 RepID=A0ABV8MLR6_9NEIS